MSVPIARLSGRKLNSLHKAVSQPPLSPNFAQTGPHNPHRRVFVAHFDGTQNDYKDVPWAAQETLVADSFQSLPDSAVLINRYYAGVGTRTDGFMGLVQSAFGFGCESRAEKAYTQLVEATRLWLVNDPLAEVHVHVVGFSRGAASGLHFMNLVHERGIKASWKTRGGSLTAKVSPKGMAPGRVKTSAVLLDTVATGQTDVLRLGLPPSAVSVLHVTAGGEQRYLFPLQSLTDSGRPSEIAQAHGVRLPGSQEEAVRSDPLGVSSATLPEPIIYRRLHQIMLDGASHSDVGGSYRNGGIRLVSTYLMKEFQASLGIPVQSSKPSFSQVQNMHGHDSRYFIDKLTSARPYYKGMRRAIDDGEVTYWDGSVTETVIIESKVKGVKQQTQALRHISPTLHADGVFMQFSREQLGHEYKLTVRLADAAKGEKGRMVFESTPPGVFGRRSGSRRFMFFGKALSAAPTAEAIIARLEAGEKAFTLVVKLEKGLPVFDAGVPSDAKKELFHALQDALEPAESPDDWTPEIRKAIMRFNFGTPKMLQSNADALMQECVQSAAGALRKLPGASNMRITFHAKLLSTERRGIAIALSAASPSVSPCANLRAVQDLSKALEEGLSCLAQLVSAKGVDAYSPCNTIFERIAEIDDNSPYPKRILIQEAGIGAAMSILRPESVGDISYDDQSLWARLKEARTASPRLQPLEPDQMPQRVAKQARM